VSLRALARVAYDSEDMVYYDQEPPSEDERPGCLDALLITRAVFGILFWPLAAIAAVLADLMVTGYLFITYAPLALIPIAVTAVALWLFSRWERTRFGPPGL